MKKAIALILGLLIGGGLMIYSATRTVDLLQMTLPIGQKDMAYLALLAFDGGLIAWTLVFMFGAEGAWQRAISMLMICVCLVGVLIGFGADQILGARSGGLIDAARITDDFGLTATLATVGIIAANIAAIVFFHVMSPDNRRRMQEETFHDQIESAAEKKSNEEIPALAAQLADQMTRSRMARIYATYQARIAREYTGLQLPAAQEIIDQPPQTAAHAPAAAPPEPSRMDKIKDALGNALHGNDAQPQTMAAEGTIVPDTQQQKAARKYQEALDNMRANFNVGGGSESNAHFEAQKRLDDAQAALDAAQATVNNQPAARPSTEEWRLNNAARDLDRAERAHHGTPPNMQYGESMFRPHDPMAN